MSPERKASKKEKQSLKVPDLNFAERGAVAEFMADDDEAEGSDDERRDMQDKRDKKRRHRKHKHKSKRRESDSRDNHYAREGDGRKRRERYDQQRRDYDS